MRITLVLMCGFVCVLLSLSVQDGFAAIYKYVDQDGLINFADDLQSVPAPYRATAKIVSGEAPEQSLPSPSTHEQSKARTGAAIQKPASATVPAGLNEKQKSTGTLLQTGSIGKRALTSAIIVVSAVFAFIILGILDTDHKKAVTVVRVVLLWGMTVYLLYAHAGDVVHIFSRMDSEIESIQQQSDEKGKKAARAMKSLNTMVEEAGQATADPEGAGAGKKE